MKKLFKTTAVAIALSTTGAYAEVTTNDSVVADGIVTVRVTGSVYDVACSCSKSAIVLRTSGGTEVLTKADGLTNAQVGEPIYAVRFAEARTGLRAIMVDDQGQFTNAGPDGILGNADDFQDR